MTAKAARNDVYRAANSILRLVVEGRLIMCMRPPGFTKDKCKSAMLEAKWIILKAINQSQTAMFISIKERK